MTLEAATDTSNSQSVVHHSCADATDPLILATIYQPERNIVTWQRSLDPALQSTVEALIRDDSNFEIRIVGSLTGISKSLFEHLLHVDDCEHLIADIAVLVDMFAELFELKKVGLRLAVLTKAMCPKFHVDRVPCRLVTTYQGAATQWLPNQDVDRSNGIRATVDESGTRQETAGDVILLKGESWEGNEGSGAVHRSPPASAESPRLVLTLDFA